MVLILLFCRLTLTTQADIVGQIEQGRIERVGITDDVESRRKQYRREGYTGIMMYAQTVNKRKTEDKFLRLCSECHLNIQRRSNAFDEPGYVYGIRRR